MAKPALLLPLEQARAQDAKLACFMRHKPLTKIVIIVQQLLTSAFPAILHALQVSSEALFTLLSSDALVQRYHHVVLPDRHIKLSQSATSSLLCLRMHTHWRHILAAMHFRLLQLRSDRYVCFNVHLA